MQRALAIVCLAVASASAGFVLLHRSGSETLYAQFLNARGLVTGGRVQMGGQPVGSISGISLTRDGHAKVAMKVDPGTFAELRQGTRADVRMIGAAGITNNYVALTPGPIGEPRLPPSAVLPVVQTSSVVSLDVFLQSFGPRQRADLDEVIKRGDEIFAGSGAPYFNRMLAGLEPALADVQGFGAALAADRGTLSELVGIGSSAAGAIAEQGPQLASSITKTRRALDAVAGEEAALSDSLSRLPGVLGKGAGTLRASRRAVVAIRPALRALRPAARPLNAMLLRLNELLPRAAPVVSLVTAELPGLTRALNGAVPLKRPVVRTLSSAGSALHGLRPIAEGMRYYGTDVALGSLASLFGSVAAEYDAQGHYSKANYVQSLPTLVTGSLAELLAKYAVVPGQFQIRTDLTRRCPGGNEPPASDGSSPWLIGEKYCSPSHNIPASVQPSR